MASVISFYTSVIICTYNGAKYIESQLLSILNQTHKVDEILVCDDISTDDTTIIIGKYIKQFPELIKLKINEVNVGAKKNFEQALSIATGEIIFLSDQDDIWHFNKVEEYLKIFENNSNIKGVFSNAQLINENGEKVPSTLWESIGLEPHESAELKYDGVCAYIINYANIVTGATLALRRAALETVLPFHLMDRLWHDEWMGMAMAAKDELYLMDKVLMDYRIHDEQQLGIGSKKEAEQRIELTKYLKSSDHNSLEHLNYWSNVLARLVMYQQYLELSKYMIDVRKKLFFVRRSVLQKETFFIRKLKIIKWSFYKVADTTMVDLFKI